MFGFRRPILKTRSSRITRRGRRHFLSKFEALEDRRLLATLTVTTTIDRLDPSVTLAHRFGPDGKLSLREAIYLANINPGPDTVVLKKNSTYNITLAPDGPNDIATGDFNVLDSLTIKSTGSGSNPIINGNGLDRVFEISGGSEGVGLTLDHVVVTGGIARGYGGAVDAEAIGNTLTLLYTTLTGNVSTNPGGGLGGGIYNLDGDINVINSHVDGNSAAAGANGTGGGIFTNGESLIIKNSTVNGNTAYDSGGGICDTGSAFTVINSQISNNSAGSDGGGALVGSLGGGSSVVTITNSTFSGNNAGADFGGGLKVLGSLSQITITKSNFINNSAVSDGGAVWSDEGSVTISGSKFQNNTSTAGDGGALGNVGAVIVTNSTFNHNVADGVGGAIDEEVDGANITITGSTFTKNASLTNTGGAINGDGDGTIQITNSMFTYNSSDEQGGAIAADGDSVTIKWSTFDHNTCVTDDGGAIDDAIVTASNSAFTNNTAKGDGGAIASEDNNISLNLCTFSGNTATNGEGGAFNDGGPDSTITVINCTISGNTAGGNGGGFAAEGTTLTMTGSTISGNQSGSEGGGIYILTSGLNNVAYGSGPVSPGSLIVNCTIANNGSEDAGGGIDFEGDGDLTIINVTIAFNASNYGGGIAQTDGSGVIHIGNTIVAKNTGAGDPDAYNTTTFDDLGHNLVFSDPDGLFSNGSDLFGVDPKLESLANYGGPTKTLALPKSSPAINAGDDTLAPLTDQRGVSRPRGAHADIGAFERKL